jgi:hypothetical protein
VNNIVIYNDTYFDRSCVDVVKLDGQPGYDSRWRIGIIRLSKWYVTVELLALMLRIWKVRDQNFDLEAGYSV